jgi:hypothetical protein
MKQINSFDIFDTLLARTVKEPTDIFKIIENKLGYSNFKNIRIQAQSQSDNTIDNIYDQFKLITNESDNNINILKNYEIQTELENTIPIISNILKIKNDDIYVSDMYLDHNNIIKLLKYHNINTDNNKLYVSSNGKYSGKIWDKLVKEYNINTHTGDNMYSDIIMANKFGINTNYTQIYKFSALEDLLIEGNFELCTLFRRFRLCNPYDESSIEYKVYDQQIQYNIPILLFICKQLSIILDTENRDTILFLSRDGCLIYKIFKKLYPQYNSHYIYSSRIINQSNNSDYILYLKQYYNKDKCIIFDLHGSFDSARNMFLNEFGHLPRVFIFDLSKPQNLYPNMTFITHHSNKIEILNQDMIGSLINFINNKPINMPTENPLKYIKIMHDTVESFISYSENYKLNLNNTIFNDKGFWSKYYIQYVITANIIMPNNHNDHSNNLLTTLANKYNSDKGSTYKCAHYYTQIYQEILSDLMYCNNKINNINNMDLLEIGLNRDNYFDIPSLLMWNEYFNGNINITGFDIEEAFLQFNSKYNNINIVIGDQSNELDLQKLKDKKYDIIIDDGYHASKHQQISFKTLWDSVKSNGYYIIEDLHYQPIAENCIKTKTLFEQWKNNNWIECDYITASEIESIKKDIESINFYDSKSTLWGDSTKNALVYIKKK